MKNIRFISRKHHIYTVLNTPIYVSNLWLVIFLLLIVAFSQPGVIREYIQYTSDIVPYQVVPIHLFEEETVISRLSGVLFGVIFVLCIYLSVILHEIGHVYGATRNNIPTHNITLWFLGGAANITQAPDSPRNSFEIVVFGPIITAILTFLSFVMAYVLSITELHIGTSLFHFIFILNASVLIFNLIPAFPLDGGRMLRSILNLQFGYYRSTLFVTRFAKLFAVGLAIVSFIISNIFVTLVAGFIYFSAQSEHRNVSEKFDPKNIDIGNITVSEKHFLFNVPPEDLQTPQPMRMLQQNGGIIDHQLDYSTDYIIVPDGTSRKYSDLAAHYNATPVTASTIDELLVSVLLDDPETIK